MPKDKKARYDYDNNHVEILEAYWKMLDKTGKPPTITALAKETGFTRSTIAKHIKTMDLTDGIENHKIQKDAILKGLAKRAIEAGDASAAKLYFQLVYDWSEKQKIDNNITADIKITKGKRK